MTASSRIDSLLNRQGGLLSASSVHDERGLEVAALAGPSAVLMTSLHAVDEGAALPAITAM